MAVPVSIAESVVVTLPLPPKEASPNGRFHYLAKARAVKRYRAAAWCEAYRSITAWSRPPRWPHAAVQITYYHKTAAFKDSDNIIASLKSAIDGLTDAGVFSDDRDLTYPPVRRFKDAANPRVVFTITPTAA